MSKNPENTRRPPVEALWHSFVRSIGGSVLDDIFVSPPSFQNADYLFGDANVVAELKEIETEFMRTEAGRKGSNSLHTRVVKENASWRPMLLGGDGKYPDWFAREYVRLARAPIARILKKANSQIRETKEHFKIQGNTGLLLLVNDGFIELGPDIILGIAAEILTHSYSSIDCLVYLNVASHVQLRGSSELSLIWHPVYSDRADDKLVEFVTTLGRNWFDFLEDAYGPFDSREELGDAAALALIKGARSVRAGDEGAPDM
jgi:hypothetical protein